MSHATTTQPLLTPVFSRSHILRLSATILVVAESEVRQEPRNDGGILHCVYQCVWFAPFVLTPALAFLALLCLVLILLLHFAPYTITGIPSTKRINMVSLMLVLNAAVRCVIAAVDVAANRGVTRLACSVDSIW